MKTAAISCALIMLLGASASCVANDTPIERGREVFDHNCASCHGPGIGNPGLRYKPGTDALRAKYKGELPALLADRTDLTPEMVAFFVRNGVSIMPFYRKTEISDSDLKALGAYLSRNRKPEK